MQWYHVAGISFAVATTGAIAYAFLSRGSGRRSKRRRTNKGSLTLSQLCKIFDDECQFLAKLTPNTENYKAHLRTQAPDMPEDEIQDRTEKAFMMELEKWEDERYASLKTTREEVEEMSNFYADDVRHAPQRERVRQLYRQVTHCEELKQEQLNLLKDLVRVNRDALRDAIKGTQEDGGETNIGSSKDLQNMFQKKYMALIQAKKRELLAKYKMSEQQLQAIAMSPLSQGAEMKLFNQEIIQECRQIQKDAGLNPAAM